MGFTETLKKIGHDVKAVAITIKKGFIALFGAPAAHQFAQASLALLKSAIGQIVTKVVEDMANTSLDSTAKREGAVTEILSIAAQQGIIVAESEVRLLIEVAVQFVTGKITVAPAALGAAAPVPSS